MNKWKSYSEKSSHSADFEIAYEFIDELEGGRKTLPFQGYRCDFEYYPMNDHSRRIYMIWPEFYSNDGSILTDLNVSVDKQGRASMWILDQTMRVFHQNHLKEGTTGFLVEGSRRVAQVIVTRIVGLFTNPV
ncbi:hypothetical protein EHQ52_17025 [Leptospira koniambonensis]|uniref:Uncharacterized protein n=1 Tax=Leptospira koniambonensis TaxID=2484950 RepID=A0A4R9J3L1_9LEPT|nr:hypothetical protein [Leptospira koniambonensis]TGL31629.1 hypothetical protein EHQ52_17025 [Leptospira koniambonensis]